MKKLFWIILILISVVYILFRSTPLESIFPDENVPLDIVGQEMPLVLYVDNRLIGTLPLNDVSVTPGVHTFSLYSVVGDETSKQWWQEEIEVNSGDDLKLVIQAVNDQVEGVALVRLFDESRSNLSRIYVSPDLAEMTVEGTRYTEFPVVFESLSAGEHIFEIDGDIYSSMDIAVQLPAKTQVEMHVQVFFDYLSSINKASDLVIEPRLDAAVPITRRWDWGAVPAPIPANSLATATWESLDIYQMGYPPGNTLATLVKNLEQTFREQGDLFRIPFCFIIGNDGGIYEGLGIWNYDYTQLSSGITSFYKGGCPVLLLGGEVTGNQQRALNYLAAFIKEPPQLSATIEQSTQTVTAQTEEILDVSITARNTGWGMWRNINNQSVTVRLNNQSRRSDIYHADVWVNDTTPTTMEDPLVIPGAETTFIVPLKAPTYPIAYDEVFSLYQDDTKITGSDVTLSMAVSGQGSGVEIQDTPIGFLNVRETPSGNGRLVGSAYPGERFLLLESTGIWHKIRLSDGTEGWVSGDYITELPKP